MWLGLVILRYAILESIGLTYIMLLWSFGCPACAVFLLNSLMFCKLSPKFRPFRVVQWDKKNL
ncbi:hypothetical protein [Rubritalea tangerina]|uniref:hypothetical protein n=1 Tax=Rubritalea tangerina TaxID=430798 RepID=UPI0036231B1A